MHAISSIRISTSNVKLVYQLSPILLFVTPYDIINNSIIYNLNTPETNLRK